MTPSQLESVVADTGLDRLRWLTSDDNPRRKSREGYRRWVRDRADALAAGQPAPESPTRAIDPPPPAVPLADSLRARKLGGRNCPHGRAPRCGCSGMAWCKLLKRDVTLRDCLECLTTGPRAGEGE